MTKDSHGRFATSGERCLRMTDTSRVTAMCSGCQKTLSIPEVQSEPLEMPHPTTHHLELSAPLKRSRNISDYSTTPTPYTSALPPPPPLSGYYDHHKTPPPHRPSIPREYEAHYSYPPPAHYSYPPPRAHYSYPPPRAQTPHRPWAHEAHYPPAETLPRHYHPRSRPSNPREYEAHYPPASQTASRTPYIPLPRSLTPRESIRPTQPWEPEPYDPAPPPPPLPAPPRHSHPCVTDDHSSPATPPKLLSKPIVHSTSCLEPASDEGRFVLTRSAYKEPTLRMKAYAQSMRPIVQMIEWDSKIGLAK